MSASFGARAAEQAIHATSVADSGSSQAWDAFKRVTALSYYGVYYGPSVSRMDSLVPNEYGQTGKTNQFFLNYLTLGVHATDDVSPGIVVMSTYSPVRGQGLTLIDPYLKITDTRMIHTAAFNLYSELRYFVPVTKASHNADLLGKLGTFQAVTYQIAHTPLTVGAWAKFYWDLYGSDAHAGKNFEAYFRPDLFYQISPKLQAALYYEMFANHFMNSAWQEWDTSGLATDVQAGVMWTVAPGVILNPYLQFATGGKVTTDSTALGAQIFATVL
jgi:hypothetical protein